MPPVLAVFLRLVAMMRRRRGSLALSVAAGTLAALLSLSPHLAVALSLVELLDGAPDGGRIALYALLGAIGVVGRHVAYGLAMLVSHRVAYATQYELRRSLADKLARVPLGFFDQRAKGALRTTLLNDVDMAEDGMAHLVPETLAALLTPLLAFTAMAALDWRLALLVLAPTATGVWLVGALMRRGGEVTRRYQAMSARMAHVAAEFAEGLATLRSFNQSNQALDRARAAFAGYTTLAIDWLRRSVAPAGVAQLILVGNLMLVAPAGMLMQAQGMIATDTLVVFLVLSIGFGDLFAGIAGLAHRLTRQVAVLDRIDGILEAPELPVPSTPLLPADGSVEFRDVGFSYGGRRVLDGVTFRVGPGRCLALVGASGSGKSTITRLIARFHDVEDGSVLIGGADVRSLAPDDLHAHVAMVFQDVFLFAGTVRDNIRLGRPDAGQDAVVAAAVAAGAHGFITRLPQGYDTPLGELGQGLSGGERQRLSIARAILKDAPILVLDEATAFADAENEALIQDAVARLAAGRTVIVIAHRLSTIVHADEILVLDSGRVVERGRHTALVAAGGAYAALWQAHEEAHRFHHGGGRVAEATP